MSDWVVVVKPRGSPERKRIFVEDILFENDAQELACLKLGINPLDQAYESRAELVHERVSVETPIHNIKELYEQASVELTSAQRELQEAQALSRAYLTRALKVEEERDNLVKDINLIASNLALIKSTLNETQKLLEKRK